MDTKPKKRRERGKKIMFWLPDEQVFKIRQLAEENGLRGATAWIRYMVTQHLRKASQKV